MKPKGTVRREKVSNVEIWAECFGNDPMLMKKQDSYDISAILIRIRGWERIPRREYIPLYGRQRVYVRAGKEVPQENGTAVPGMNQRFF